MEAFLKADKNIQVLYAHNDQMALGAIQAIKEAGLKPGKDIIIVGVDAVKGAFEAMVAGEMNCLHRVQPPARAPGGAGRARPARRQEAPRPDLDDRGHLRRDQRRRGAADPPVLIR